MTYLPNHILTIICDYCGETIEQRQKRLQIKVNKAILMVRIQSKCIYRGGEKYKLTPSQWVIDYIDNRLQKLQDLYLQIDYEAPFIILSPHVCLGPSFNGDLTNIDNWYSDNRNLLCDW
jgi:hypothetical protein